MGPAGQGSEARDLAGRQLDQRRKGEAQPILLDRAPKRGLQPEAVVRHERRLGLVDFDAVGLLRALERDLRVANLVGDIALARSLDRAAQRAVDADLQVADAKGVVETAADAPRHFADVGLAAGDARSEEHPSELQSLMRIPYAVFCLIKK